MILLINFLFTLKNQVNGQVQNNKDIGRRGIRYSIQGNEHKNKLNRGNKENETEIFELERMCVTAINKVPTQTEPHQRNKT